ncbi:hypothetical protein ABFS82_02G006500 [Erythranthe guttata]|uniref:Translation initiation factor 3 N-terminal domain-containing protein n=1 Tax=Erythranthe guttata TaxID=4155 RepID=A0A022RCB6_ERYGU|nr:PREDICTED: histone-lysine N-methyltransferase, H3 lysine-36 specific [Erythranthe guttata]EYU37972.1 hypothetical protein MIMGU_mgv1a005097mg [Erythranthe guttata]|eukprot:XP_012837199.1 PREDICTED: histone-lysine N-methyltransferase, H3 lysine-36 specific [Erythranthe guttata]
MVFWSRLRQLKLNLRIFSDEFRRCYTLNHGPIVSDQRILSRASIPVLDNPKFAAQVSQLEIFRQVRSYAAPVQYQKKEEKDESGIKLNEQITAPLIRLVTDEDHYVISRHEALARAKDLKMDLVLVDMVSKPPVCKIFDYNKEKYLQQTKERERSKNKSTLKKACKEVRFTAKIKPNDLQVKADMAKRLMASGYRVKCVAAEPTSDLDLETLINRFAALIEDVAVRECEPLIEKKQACLVVRHIKFGPLKNGPGKKASSNAATTENQENGETTIETEHAKSEELSDEVDDVIIPAVFNTNDEVNNGPHKNPEPVITGPSPYSSNRSPRTVVEPAAPPVANRYARDPRSGKPPGIPTDTNNRVPNIPNHGNQPQFSVNAPPQRRPNLQVEVSKQDSSSRSSIPNSPNKSYGVFTGQQQQRNTPPPPPPPPREQNIPGENNRYKKSVPSDTARSQSQMSTDPRVHRGPPGVDNSGQGKWGVFNRDNSNVIPNTNENHRR